MLCVDDSLRLTLICLSIIDGKRAIGILSIRHL